MRTRDAVTAEKLRGGFYSPDPLVDLCLDRIASLTRGREAIRFLEPSAGDGAFLRGLARHPTMSGRTAVVDAIEPFAGEAKKCSDALADHKFAGEVHVTSAVTWAAISETAFDAAAGNPPFVRFQFLSSADKVGIEALQRRLGISFTGVSNLWLPVLLGALSRLLVGGAFAFIVPAECFTGISAGIFRKWLIENSTALRFDLFPPGSFPFVLQEVVIMSGRRARPSNRGARCEILEHASAGTTTSIRHSIPSATQSWTRYLLTTAQLEAFEEASRLPTVWALGDVARFEVAAVTGANDYFSVDEATLEAFELGTWSTPLLPRIRHAPGLRYISSDHALAGARGAKTHLLDFSSDRPDPNKYKRAAAYLRVGVAEGLPARYKCRIRTPWYRVPFIRSGDIMLSKRSHLYPRVVLNDLGVVTTDTIYRGSMVGFCQHRGADLVAAFHNSLTLLSAEVEGRSFGGGVLELVPSEVARLAVPIPQGFGAELDRLDALAREGSLSNNAEALVDETDLLLAKADMGLTSELTDLLRAGRQALARRRLDRNEAS
ncbi:MAG: Eco57I restriction-modification methylase domain-containing protein [Deltaproteobacteria bacterium]